MRSHATKKVVKIAVGLALIGVLAATLVAVSVDTQPARSADTPGPAQQVASVPGSLLVWVTRNAATPSGDNVPGDGLVHVRMSDVAGQVHNWELGDGMKADLVCGGFSPVLLIESYAGDRHLVEFDPTEGTWRTTAAWESDVDIGPALLSANASFLDYQTSGPDAQIVTVDRGARVVAQTRALAPLAADPVLQQRQDAAFKGTVLRTPPVLSGDTTARLGITTALVRSGDNLYACRCSNDATVVSNLSNGKSVQLSQYGAIHSAGLGGDGSLYLAAVEPGLKTPEQLVRLDPNSLAVESAACTGWKDHSELSQMMWAPTDTGIVLLVREVPQGSSRWGKVRVWALDDGGLREFANLPGDVGSRMSLGENESVLLYGGPAANVITRLDLGTGSLSPVPELSTPNGTRVLIAVE